MSGGAPLYGSLERINQRPEVYSRYTAAALWDSPDISEMLLRFHLDGEIDVASRRTAFIDASIDWISRRFELGPGSRVVDLGCGPGLYTSGLARTGAGVTGVDFSQRSIEYAREQALADDLAIEYVHADYLEWKPPERFDLALMIMCDYCALSPTQRGRLLQAVGELLAPGGAFLFDVYSLAYYATWEEQVAYGPGLMDGFWSTQPYYGFLNTFRYDDAGVVLEKYTIVEREGVSEYFNWFQHYDVASLRAEVETAGLQVAEVVGDVAGGPLDETAPEFGIVVQRPAEG